MGRSGYSDDLDGGALNLYRGTVDRALRGRRGQAFLREMADALDAMPVKELVEGDIVRDDGHVCALGAVAVARQIDVSQLNECEPDDVGKTFGIARSMAAEIAFVNDDDFVFRRETPGERWTRVRAWVAGMLAAEEG
jgi:hypothetical protein